MNFLKYQTINSFSGYLGGDDTTTSTSDTTPILSDNQQQVQDDAMQHYEEGGLYDPNYGGGTTTGVADVNDDLNTVSGALNSMMGNGVMPAYGQALQDSLSPWEVDQQLSDAINASTQGVYDELYNSMLPSIDTNSAAAGGVGGSRQGLAQGSAYATAASDASNQAAQMTMADKQAHEQQQMQAMNNALSGINSWTGAMTNVGQLQQQQENAIEQGNLNKWLYESGVDRQTLEWMSNMLSKEQGEHTEGTQTTPSNIGQILGAVGGQAVGGLASGFGSTLGGK